MMTPERLEKVCEILYEVGHMIPHRSLSRLYLGGLAWHTSDDIVGRASRIELEWVRTCCVDYNFVGIRN